MPQQPPKAKPVEVTDLEIETQLIRDAVGAENFEKAIAAGTLGTISQEAKNNKRHQLQIEAQRASDEAWWASPEGRRARAEHVAEEAERLAEDARKARLVLEQDQRYSEVDLEALSQAELIAEAFGQPEPENDLGGFQPEQTSPAEAELLRRWTGWTRLERQQYIAESGLDDAAVARVTAARQRHSFS